MNTCFWFASLLLPLELTLFLHHLVLSQLAALREFFHSSHMLRIFLLFYHVPKSRSALRPHGGCGLGTVQVLAHAALSAGIIGAGRLLGELQASAPITLSKTAIFFSSQISLAIMYCFSCSVEVSNLPLNYQTGPFSPNVSPI